MKTKKKALVLSVCAMLLVVTTVFVTVAFLTSTTEKVRNTFTVGQVEITLDEADVDEYGVPIPEAERVLGNEYKLIPGHTYVKDPTIHVDEDSEDSWIFAKVENGLGTAGTLDVASSDWTLVPGTTNVYAYKDIVSAGDDVVVFTQFTFANTADPETYKDATIDITGYAVQADGFDTAVEAWNAAFGA